MIRRRRSDVADLAQLQHQLDAERSRRRHAERERDQARDRIKWLARKLDRTKAHSAEVTARLVNGCTCGGRGAASTAASSGSAAIIRGETELLVSGAGEFPRRRRHGARA